ncbi:MAG: ATP-binding cassette domain-containing protein, partial [Verrucomicrobia bacterium]|nr:ATP-binding cassette domain-containing protein [Verrucomicrobiota bacterium]
VKMAKQLSCNLVNLMYILDEPSIGLHPRDVGSLLRMLAELRDKGNSLLVVEHDPGVIQAADYVVDMGPGAGSQGGEILFAGPVEALKTSGTLTAEYLKQRKNGSYARRAPAGYFDIADATAHNLKHVSVRIPAGVLVCVTGVAGSGKSSLIHDVFCRKHPEAVVIDQSPVGRSSRSNPATYVGVFDAVRREFAAATGTAPALFSFNSAGACPKCKGLGVVKVELSFLDDVTMTCDECDGKRYKDEVLALHYKGKNIFDILEMTVRDALGFFEHAKILRKLKILERVGLDYLELGQSLSTLSGGEAQRLKLASELHKEGNIYVMDEPTTGLHMADTKRLLDLIRQLVDHGNSVIVIEHNLDVIKHADWIIDLGPDGGAAGGTLVAEGTPEEIARHPKSHTGRYLKEVL